MVRHPNCPAEQANMETGDVAMRASLAIASLPLALGLVAIGDADSRAERGPHTYRYCAVHSGGSTVCYFDDRSACARNGSGRCIENPSFVGPSPTGQGFRRYE